MKLGNRISGSGRPPLILFTELAEEFGITPSSLKLEMRWSKVSYPKHRLQVRSKATPFRTYYEAKPMRDWWKAHNEAKETA
jgi:hypothetical protein